MKNTKIKYEEKESDSKESFSESYSDKESSSSKNKNSSNSNENNLDNNNNNEILNITTQYEEILEFETTPIETISIKKFRNLLGIIGVKAANFIVERLYQILIRISSKKYELTSSNLSPQNFLKFLNLLNSSKKNKEIFYYFFDI